jgi:hypothetical protein
MTIHIVVFRDDKKNRFNSDLWLIFQDRLLFRCVFELFRELCKHRSEGFSIEISIEDFLNELG